MASQYQIPATPRVISPSPTPSEKREREGYFSPVTRSKTAASASVEPISEHADEKDSQSLEEDPELSRARTRSRSPQLERRLTRQMNGGVITVAKSGMPSAAASKPTRKKKSEDTIKPPNGSVHADGNGFLSPATAGFGSAYWRNLSRSPSPLGLIPIHREWRAFVHKHEIPRKVMHVSIGFLTLYLYYAGVQTDAIHPVLLSLLIPIASADIIRFRSRSFNRLYIRLLGAFMRESEAHDRYNGVIMYLAGVWATMRFCSKDVAVMTVLLLSWCDTAASTFGRLWGRYTPRIRKGKSLAGSLACFIVGVAAAVFFWGLVAPRSDAQLRDGFAFQGYLELPEFARQALGWKETESTISGSLAMGMLSLATGFVVSVSELMDVWALDDNLTIPILSGLGLTGFLWVFGNA